MRCSVEIIPEAAKTALLQALFEAMDRAHELHEAAELHNHGDTASGAVAILKLLASCVDCCDGASLTTGEEDRDRVLV